MHARLLVVHIFNDAQRLRVSKLGQHTPNYRLLPEEPD